MERASDWIKTEYVPQTSRQMGKNKRVHLVPSPYDVPSAFRATWLSADTALIEFRYIDSLEDVHEIDLPGGIKASIGKKTRRLMAIRVKPLQHDPKHVVEMLDLVIQQLSERENLRSQASWNFMAAREAFDQTLAANSGKFGSFLQPCAV